MIRNTKLLSIAAPLVLLLLGACDDSLPGTPPVVIPPGPNGNILYSSINPSDPLKSDLLFVDSNGNNIGTLGPGIVTSEPGRDQFAWTIFRDIFSTEIWKGPTKGGSGSQVLLSIAANETVIHGTAAISSDGKKVAFATFNGLTYLNSLYVYVEEAGTAATARKVASDFAINTVPAFSPDGSKIAFFTQLVDLLGEPVIGSEGFAIYDVSTSSPQLIDDLSADLPDFSIDGLETIDWSTDGTEILFSAEFMQYLYKDGQLSTSDYIHGTFSPDGLRIAYIDADLQLQVEDRIGGGRLLLTTSPDSIAMFPSWSPDGKKIVFTSLPQIFDDFDGTIKTVDVGDPSTVRTLVPGNAARAFWLRR